MAKKLVIVESPAKAKTINKILGKDYIVTSSMGHVRDLPERTLGVDVKNDYAPKYVVLKSKTKVVAELRKKAKECEAIYLAPDPDREGEAIAWHIEEVLKPENADKEFRRVEYNEITAEAVRRAFANPGHVDLNRVAAQQARRILDRLVGYTVSPMLWRKIRRGLSAGRVQSVALRLVCEREDEITRFVPEAYWIIGALARKLVEPRYPFALRLQGIDGEKAEIKGEEQAEHVMAELQGRALKVADVRTKTVTKRAPPPFITSTLQQAGSSYCGFSPKRTMSIAQGLYEGADLGEGPVGLITYMRTDSFTIAREALDACRSMIREKFGDAFCPEKPNFYKNRSSAQEAHEAIRPTDVRRTPDSLRGQLNPAQYKLYSLIWTRFVASQMAPASIDQRTVKVDAVPKEGETTVYNLQATASTVVFAGYMQLTGVEKKKGEDGEEEGRVPEVEVGESLECVEWLSERKETKPPPRYSEAALVKAMEANGVGRPSTYAQIISTLEARKYVVNQKRTLLPTELGMEVNKLLVESLNELFDTSFTAGMESNLDEVETGAVQWTSMIDDFYQKLDKWMVALKEPPADAGLVQLMLGTLESVQEWAPETKRGRRTYGDKRFADSVRDQVAKNEKPATRRQLETLAKMVGRYRKQIPDAEKILRDAGMESILSQPDVQPPKPSTVKKLELLAGMELDESTRKFVDSLHARVTGERRLTDAQLAALDRMVLARAAKIEGFEAIREELKLPEPTVVEADGTDVLVEAMSKVQDWKPAVKRGKRVFDDNAFYTSLAQQFQSKGFLSDRQKAALKKMASRYKDQIPDFEAVAAKCGMGGERKETDAG